MSTDNRVLTFGDLEVFANELMSKYARLVDLEKLWPIGSIFMSVNSENPLVHLGFGTWEQINDTFLVAQGSKYTAGNSGSITVLSLGSNTIPYRAVYMWKRIS